VPDWLKDAVLSHTPLSASQMATRLALAALFGCVIALVYRLSHGRLARDSRTLVGTLVLLTILLAMVTMVIGESVARAFGLVGALSIVRFRTVVEDTRDTAFVIFAVVVGMAVGTGLVLVAALGVPVVALAALALSARTRSPAALGVEHSRTLAVRLGAGHTHDEIDRAVAAAARSWRLAGVATARQGAAIDLTYTLDLPDTASPQSLVAHLNTIAGVQSVDLRAAGRGD
jgi:hypothetical protein